MQIRTLVLFFALLLPAMPALAKNQPSSLSLLSSAEKSYYDQIFGYTMDNMEGGQKYDWASYGGHGTIHVDKIFTSKSGYPCRTYSETFTVQSQDGAYAGTACKRQGKDGWCRLKPGNANTCAMEDKSFMFSMPSISTPTIGKVGNPLEGVSMPSAPDININTNISGPDAPKSNRPAGEGFATSVTSGAGEAAGSAAASGLGWFAKTFGR